MELIKGKLPNNWETDGKGNVIITLKTFMDDEGNSIAIQDAYGRIMPIKNDKYVVSIEHTKTGPIFTKYYKNEE